MDNSEVDVTKCRMYGLVAYSSQRGPMSVIREDDKESLDSM